MARIVYGDHGSERCITGSNAIRSLEYISSLYHYGQIGYFIFSTDSGERVVGLTKKYNARGAGYVSAETIDTNMDFHEALENVHILTTEEFERLGDRESVEGSEGLPLNKRIPFSKEQLEYFISMIFNRERVTFTPRGICGTSSCFSTIIEILNSMPKNIRDNFNVFSGIREANHFNYFGMNNFDFIISDDTNRRDSNRYTANDLNEGTNIPKPSPYIKYLASVVLGEREPIPEIEEFFERHQEIKFKQRGYRKFLPFQNIGNYLVLLEEFHSKDVVDEELERDLINLEYTIVNDMGISLEELADYEEKMTSRLGKKNNRSRQVKTFGQSDISGPSRYEIYLDEVKSGKRKSIPEIEDFFDKELNDGKEVDDSLLDDIGSYLVMCEDYQTIQDESQADELVPRMEELEDKITIEYNIPIDLLYAYDEKIKKRIVAQSKEPRISEEPKSPEKVEVPEEQKAPEAAEALEEPEDLNATPIIFDELGALFQEAMVEANEIEELRNTAREKLSEVMELLATLSESERTEILKQFGLQKLEDERGENGE